MESICSRHVFIELLGHLDGLFGLFYEFKAPFLYIKKQLPPATAEEMAACLPLPPVVFFSGQTSLFLGQ